MSDPLNQSPSLFEKVVKPLLTGLVAGSFAVGAIAVWAINVQFLVQAKNLSLAELLVRIVLCDVIPIVLLIAAFRAVMTTQSLESLVYGVARRLLGIKPKPENDQFTPFQD